ncbi:phage head closure protein [Clostridium sp. C105KSO13]|uniref:phage head closure protein n=1 Tax=Clostridium sp. C105KSO13 TaxID=1776045 RepID=UPI0007408440|nr:phage head closure protein [Clostridium sp. C105KSO13]CUX18969.1 Phage head-tail joining protein [Clostridium sp. C105KSO13]
MNIELLNVRIRLLQNAVLVDEIGNHKNSWQEYYSCYATVSAEGGTEETAAAQTVEADTIDFTLRYCRKTATLTSTGFRVEFAGEPYDITAIDHMNFKRKCVKLHCQKVRR